MPTASTTTSSDMRRNTLWTYVSDVCMYKSLQTEPFANLEPQNPPIDISEIHKTYKNRF